MINGARSLALQTARMRTFADKFRWGLRVVGPIAAMDGAGRFLTIWLNRPHHAEVRLRSGPILEFDYPAQLPSTLMMFGDFIDPEYAFLLKVCRAGWRVMDVGAAIGQFSVFAALCLKCADVHAFEPSSSNLRTLKRNIARNGVEEVVKVHQTALSNMRGIARFATTPTTWMSQLASIENGDLNSEVVEVETLDDTIRTLGFEQVNVLKINVAGFEPAVLEGATRAFRGGQIDIMVLLLGLQSLQHYASIAEMGYRFFYYHPPQGRLYEVERFDPDSVLEHRPWPARHILAIRAAALKDLVNDIVICKLES